MHSELLKSAESYALRRRRRTGWKRLVQILSCIVVFCTTYALILPAITQERAVFCGQEPHVHEAGCYIQHPEVYSPGLLCSYAALNVHEHEPECFDDTGLLLCGLADYVVHAHEDVCYDQEGQLLCPLPEAQQHIHDEDCYRPVGGHTHGEGCWLYEQGELLCTLPETAGHAHGDDCYAPGESLLCTLPEDHWHNEDCFSPPQLVCTLTGEHFHGDDCYGPDELVCTQEGDHLHEEGCWLPGPLICTEEEGHTHGEDCYTPAELLCTLSEGHSHEGECYEQALICALPEEQAHLHQGDCFQQIPLLICTEEERPGELTLLCTQPEAEIHIHTDDCFGMVSQSQLICTLTEDENHSHNDSCYGVLELICELPEHTHLPACYADLSADVETEEDWIAAFSDLELTGVAAQDLLAIAQTQLGYQESTENYITSEDGEILWGYTRYGEWYGEPYADWNGLFLAFCTYYSDAFPLPDVPDCDGWLELFEEEGCYWEREDILPQPGDVVLLDRDHDGEAERVGILSEVLTTDEGLPEELLVIEGDAGNRVKERTYAIDDEDIVGYGVLNEQTEALPEESEGLYLCGWEEHLHDLFCYNDFGQLLCAIEEHSHDDSCLEEAEILYLCGLEEHFHDASCYDELGELLCEIEEHSHDEGCLEEPEIPYLCGLEEHFHDQSCYDELGELLCETEEHSHDEGCLEEIQLLYPCGLQEHLHGETCFDETGNLLCAQIEHSHNPACEADLSQLDEADRYRVEQVILSIDALPTYEEIDEKIMEFEDAEDYEGEEIWLTAVYQQVARAYSRYAQLPQELQSYVFNRDKLLDLEYIWSAVPLIDQTIAQTIPYNANIFTEDALFVVYTTSGSQSYAFDGNGNAVPISIDADGTISANVDSKYSLLWTFANQGGSNYLIRNMATGRYMHAFANNGGGVTTTGAYSSALIASGSGVKIRSNSEYARLDTGSSRYVMTQNQSLATTYSFGILRETSIWLDGTNGGLMSLSGSANTSYQVQVGDTFTLPESWQSPAKYSYTLQGWYDVKNGVHYPPGATITVTEGLLFYADWVASTYDVGKFNSQVVDTVSTNDFITTHVFDYNTMFNTYSQNPSVSGGTASWQHVQDGTVASTNEETLDFIFLDYDAGGTISYPGNRNSANNSGGVYTGLYSDDIADLLFDPGTSFDPDSGTGVLGKHYVGTGDHLFQYGSDPADTDHYGYYYYDSRLNAASYNQSDQRFYVYNYLERTTDSAKDGGAGEYSDFLPFNSPYANTNGKTVQTYAYDGLYGEYAGMSHFMYDAKYSGGNNSTNNIGTNYWFGMSIDLEFYLPNKPGTVDESGHYANQSVTGEDMVFEFAGDDDVWVLIDGELVLDIGGIHGVKSGSIDFSTGKVYVEGVEQTGVTHLSSGRHVLTMYYLERGSSQSNFKLRFNISPRYSLTLRKEDTLTAQMLNGAEFSVFTDQSCTVPAELWNSKEAYDRDESPRNTFVVKNGVASMWGLAAGNTYYIQETKPPDDYPGAETLGIIKMKLNNKGTAVYEVLDYPIPPVGFTVHGYKISEDEQAAYLVITNAENTSEATEIMVQKKWNDTDDHSGSAVTAYLVVNGVRIREVTLNEDNDWTYVWENMPKYDGDGNLVHYTVQEATVPGYVGKVETLTEATTTITSWSAASSFTSGETYLLQSSSGYLSASGGYLSWITAESAAQAAASAHWKATVSGSNITLTNELGQTLYYSNNRFYAGVNPSSGTSLRFSSNRLGYYSGWRTYNMDTLSGGSFSRNSNGGTTFTLYQRTTSTETIQLKDINYRITNTPVGDAVISLTVNKAWDLGNLGQTSMYESLTVQVQLLANGEDSGLALPLNLRNGWTNTFSGLPVYDSDGEEIVYTVKEVWFSNEWRAEYGEITLVEGASDAYETTITNVYTLTYQLPETGGGGLRRYITAGGLVIVASGILLLYQYAEKRKREGSSSS